MPDKPPFDFLDWQKRLEEISGHPVESEWPDPVLNRIERSLLKDASQSALAWLMRIWSSATRAIKKPSEHLFDRILEATEEDPIDVENTADIIANTINIGVRRGKHQILLPDKGPWVDVPKKPDTVIHVSQPKLHRLAEWVAKQSAGAKMREWAEGMREDVRWQVAQAIRDRVTAEVLADRLKERWNVHGAKFLTIAVTEMGMAYNEAFLTVMAGHYVVVPTIGDSRVCNECHRLLEGKVFWVSPVPIENPTKQEAEQYIWPGKSNVGRKKADWWACCPLHPLCRHVYVRYRGNNPYSYKTNPK
ncbi:MAG: phage head morphogenesis protein [Alicyclobacillus sp.]|nr:phage head morphogenesis protein [Alicyclobacillus sp.]